MTETLFLTDAQARVVASWWHGGMRCPLYALSSTGYISEATEPVITELLADATEADREPLAALLAYVTVTGHREPVDGWHLLWDDAFEDEHSEE